jgi:cyclophilin family peptidyl-prolyl cis-trans isomerase
LRRLAATSIALLALLLAACGSDDEKKDAGSTTQAPATTAATETTPTETEASGAKGCEQVSQPPTKPDGGEEKPAEPLDPGKVWSLDFETTCGDFTVRLNLAAAPKTGASLVALAESGFYDDTIFHRIVPGFVIQGGDPTGTGTGGPGYSTVDPPPRDTRYTKGVVAMAKTAAESPGTAGSQFYIVTGEDAGLPPEYALVGQVTDGLDVVERIGALGDEAEQPTQVIVVEKVTAKGT